MEEQKKAKMEVMRNKESKETSENQKYTYEQLNNFCNELFQENQYLKQRLQQLEKFAQTINRLEYLFKVVELSNKNSTFGFDQDFVSSCIAEIQDLMTIPEETEKGEPKEN